MKTIVLDNVLSQKELHFLYSNLISSDGWNINAISSLKNENSRFEFNTGPVLQVKDNNEIIKNNVFFMWGQTLVHRIHALLEKKNIGIPTSVFRMWFNTTYNGKKTQHWLHRDDNENTGTKSILLFMTPIWQPDWRGSFYVDGEKFEFKPGSAIIFDSNEFHKGESPLSETYNWQRVTCNILIK